MENNYMKQVADMFGLKLNEKFRVIELDENEEFKFTDEGLFNINRNRCLNDDLLNNILTGIYHIKFNPKEGEEYYYFFICKEDKNLKLEHSNFYYDNINDLFNYKLDNCFRNQKEAMNNKNRIERICNIIKYDLTEGDEK